MTDKELRKLKRSDLLEILTVLSEENEQLSKRIDELEKQLSDRMIKMENSGSIAEAALALSKVFEEAQAAADLYLQSIKAKELDITANNELTDDEGENE